MYTRVSPALAMNEPLSVVHSESDTDSSLPMLWYDVVSTSFMRCGSPCPSAMRTFADTV